MPRPRTCIDRGGTFTDVVTVDETGRATLRKVPSDRAVAGDLAPPDSAVTLGTTVATNALLQRRGVPTLLVVTEGFADLVRIRDMTRPDLFDPDRAWPEPLATRVIEVPGRLGPDGVVLAPLALPDVWPLDGIEAVAVVLMHAPWNPAHERAVAEALRRQAPGVHVALGHRVSPEVGYLARIETTLVEAAVTPVLAASLRQDRVGPGWSAVRSDGSLCPAEQLGAADAVLSGPATGVLAVAAVARQAGVARAVGLDMGGTSTDVCLVDTTRELPRREGTVAVADVFVRRPMLEVHTIGCGGGSILATDGIRLSVGPASAGADPGPQCAGRGGPPTLTDAALAAGLVDPDAFDPPLDPARVALPAEAEAFLEVARGQMAAAIRELAASRGVDVADHALVAFGGAAGQHAAWVAERLGVRRVLVHPAAAGLCAFGQALARREESAVRPLWAPFPGALPEAGRAAEELVAALPALGEVHTTVSLRHRGTDHALEVALAGPEQVRAAFEAAHRARYGFDRDLPLELVDVRVRVREPAPAAPAFDGDPFGLGDGVLAGPRRLDAATTSVAVPAGWTARWAGGLLQLERVADGVAAIADPSERTPAGVALWASRFQAVAAQAGAVLQRTARSVNIRERLDFSCAVFDAEGALIANAPHVPVHLGAMGETVRDLLRAVPDPEPGQHWLTNDPAAGGSHLPDLTVVSPVRVDGARLFVASRAHHVDVGGVTPGSMPPRSRAIAEEGFVVRHLPLIERGRLRADLAEHLAGCRALDTVLADLEAQIAANVAAARWLAALGPGEVLAAWAGHLQDAADESLAAVLDALPAPAEAADRIDGVPLRVAIALSGARRDASNRRPPLGGAIVRRGDGLEVDFTGSGGPHEGNLNAPRAVVRAAVLYALRVLAGRPIPLNDGALRRVRIVCPAGSVLDPPPGAAIAGGNVETSQRLVDLVLRAAGYAAGSAGSMSNLTVGNEAFSLYETIGGGQGASPRGPGPSGRQVHMTNTRATDAEVLEQRLPLRVVRFGIRGGSGGEGRHRGGDGLVREIEVLVPCTAALLATRRGRGAPGLGGGGDGVPGVDEVRVGGVWRAWDGAAIALCAGDRVRVATPGGGGWGR